MSQRKMAADRQFSPRQKIYLNGKSVIDISGFGGLNLRGYGWQTPATDASVCRHRTCARIAPIQHRRLNFYKSLNDIIA